MSADSQVEMSDTSGDNGDVQSREELQVQLEVLAEENQQLRESYIQAKTSRYRQTALGLVGVGLIAALSGLVLPAERTILFSLGGIGLFGGVLTYLLTPEQFVAADVGRDVYAMLADNEAALVSELGLADERVYVPVETEDAVRLFIPQETAYTVPDSGTLSQTLLASDTGDTRGVAFNPSGRQLLEAVDNTISGGLSSEPIELADQLTEAIVEQFEIATTATSDIDVAGGRLTVGISGSVYGRIDRFDHPIPSLLATGLADGLDTQVTTEIVEGRDGQAEYLVTCRWEQSE